MGASKALSTDVCALSVEFPSAADAAEGRATESSGALEKALCAGRSPCLIAIRREVQGGAAKRPAEVVLLDLGLQLHDAESAPPEGTTVSDGRTTEGDVDSFTSAGVGYSGGCWAFEYWFVEPGTSAPPSLLARLCNDGHGAASVGENWVEVKPDRFVVSRSGGSAWRWSESFELGFAPVRLLRATTEGFWTLGPNRSSSTTDFVAGKEVVSWWSPPCGEDGSPSEGDSDAIGSGPVDGVDFEYAPIPRYDASPSELLKKNFRGCALEVRSSGASGYVVHGSPGADGDARFHVVAAGDRLVVELGDDEFLDGKNWVASDHFELWLSDDVEDYYSHCLAKSPAAEQWGIRVSDGAVFAGAGKPDPEKLRVERLEIGEGLRFVLHLPPGKKGVTLVYSDADGKPGQERLIATSRFRFKDARTLGRFGASSKTAARCVDTGAAFERVFSPPSAGRAWVE